jgi:hypothetical protein
MQCPQCGHEQDGDLECFRCGIVFSKYRPSPPAAPLRRAFTPQITYYNAAHQRRRIWLLLGILGFVAVLCYNFQVSLPISHPPGVLAPTEPEQVILKQGPAWKRGERLICALARFNMKGRVLSTERYRWDATADLSPIDVALGWGPMSDQRILDALEIVQGNRRYVLFPLGDTPPLPWPVIMVSSSNVHMIPADSVIEGQLKSLRVGQLIEVSGFLVGVQEKGQWVWVSSLSRKDTGDGACEILWVEQMRTL